MIRPAKKVLAQSTSASEIAPVIAMTATAMPATRRAYSIADAPDSSLRKRVAESFMFKMSFDRTRLDVGLLRAGRSDEPGAAHEATGLVATESRSS